MPKNKSTKKSTAKAIKSAAPVSKTEASSYLEYPSASLFRRLAAMVYDLLILVAVWIAIGFIYMAIAGLDSERDARTLQVTLFPMLFLGTLLFYGWFWTHGGQTLGMRAWRLKVVDGKKLDGRPPNALQCVSRSLVATLSLSSFGLGYLWLYVDANRDTWHDKLSSTRTLVVPPEVNKKVSFFSELRKKTPTNLQE